MPHSHATKSAEALRMLRASPETKATFQKYFEAGLAPSAAIRHHESLLSARPDGPMLLANGSVNPIQSAVYRWHQEWRVNQFGPPGNPSATLQEKASHYESQGELLNIGFNIQSCLINMDASVPW